MKSITKNNGFTLVEVLIAFFVLAVGLLGAVGLQVKAKQASYDAVQRSSALALANDIIERIRANDTATIVNNYTTTFTSDTALSNPASCLSSVCSSAQMAAYDIEEWTKAVRIADSTGSLANATVCITPTVVSTSGGAPVDVTVEVIVSWEGREKLVQTADNAARSCGTADNKRRMVVVDGYILLRA